MASQGLRENGGFATGPFCFEWSTRPSCLTNCFRALIAACSFGINQGDCSIVRTQLTAAKTSALAHRFATAGA
jgi:hypothetical protein